MITDPHDPAVIVSVELLTLMDRIHPDIDEPNLDLLSRAMFGVDGLRLRSATVKALDATLLVENQIGGYGMTGSAPLWKADFLIRAETAGGLKGLVKHFHQ